MWLWREHDSTGLRAETKLNTPLLRCESPENRAQFLRCFRDDTADLQMGSACSPFAFADEIFLPAKFPRLAFYGRPVLEECAVPLMMTPGAVLAHVPIVRSGLVRLRPKVIVSALRRRIRGRRRLYRRGKNCGCCRQQKNAQGLFHERCSGRVVPA